MHVVVIGGGAVGLCVAEALTRHGAEVTVLERDRCGGGASAGNAGWVTPSLAIPVPGPGVIGQALRWLIDPSGPLWIRPTLSPVMLGWLARFVAKCSRPAYRRSLVALQAAATLAGATFDRVAESGVEFEMHAEPLLYPAFEQPELHHLLAIADQLRDAGGREQLERVGPCVLRELEPALGDGLLGGLVAHGERRVRPERFVSGLRRALAERTAQVSEHTPVDGLAYDCGSWLAGTPRGSYRGDAIVLSSGVETARLLAPHGVRLPVVAAKGYSRTFARDASAPRRALYLEKPKVAISAFDGKVRVSGTLELGARDLTLSQRRLTAITAAAQQAMPGWEMPRESEDWAGMRSLSPDGLPFIGAVSGLANAYLATAHATLGITLAPLSAELLAQLILHGKRDPLLAAFDPARIRHTRGSSGGRR